MKLTSWLERAARILLLVSIALVVVGSWTDLSLRPAHPERESLIASFLPPAGSERTYLEQLAQSDPQALEFYLQLTPTSERREALSSLAEKAVLKQPCIRYELCKRIARESATTAPEKARFLIAQSAYLKSLEHDPQRQKGYLDALSKDPHAVRNGFTGWDHAVRAALADPDLWSYYQDEKSTQTSPFWLDEVLLTILQLTPDGQELKHSPELVREIVAAARKYDPIARRIVRDLQLGAEGMLLLIQYGPLIEQAVREQLDLQEVLEILYANPGEFEGGESSELVLQMKEIYSKNPAVWNSARHFPLCWKLHREFPKEASQLLEKFAVDDIASFLYLHYPEQMPEAISALRSTGDAALGTLRHFAEVRSDNREIFKDLLKKQGWRVIPYYLKYGDSGLQRLRENPEDTKWLDKDFDAEGHIVNPGWIADLPVLSGPVMAFRHGIEGTLEWEEVGWAALDLTDAAALVGTSGVSLIWSVAKNSAKIGSKKALKRVLPREAREILLQETKSITAKPAISRVAKRQAFRDKSLPSLLRTASQPTGSGKYLLSHGTHLILPQLSMSLQTVLKNIQLAVQKVEKTIPKIRDLRQSLSPANSRASARSENLPSEEFLLYLKHPDQLVVLQTQLFDVSLLSRWNSPSEFLEPGSTVNFGTDISATELAEEILSFWSPASRVFPVQDVENPVRKIGFFLALGSLTLFILVGAIRYHLVRPWAPDRILIGSMILCFVVLGLSIRVFFSASSPASSELTLARLKQDSLCWEQRLAEVLDSSDPTVLRERDLLVETVLQDYRQQLSESSGRSDLQRKEQSLRLLKRFFPILARAQVENLIAEVHRLREEQDYKKVQSEFENGISSFKESAQRFLSEYPRSESKKEVHKWINEKIGKEVGDLRVKIQQIENSNLSGIAERAKELAKLCDQLSRTDPERNRIQSALKVAHLLMSEKEFTLALRNSGEFQVAEFHRVVITCGDETVHSCTSPSRVQIQDWTDEFKLKWQPEKSIKIELRLGSTVIFSRSLCAETEVKGEWSILDLNGKKELEVRSARFLGTPYVTLEILDFTSEEEKAFRTYFLGKDW
ncbi:hypothetical protein KIH39_22825 [Telmatocola sphagniphila]|uniref:Uncharacterized protein n=1 Tax=Telmatocola sphagniphila TaxID=1123043 RepID=A0A8E6B480_9BACT|nr:hypothetical protein [Telmatocola sphagniphila]QVL31648.1 hypothetical protein KIH39_22825 [Telmatocola sphagniphila]